MLCEAQYLYSDKYGQSNKERHDKTGIMAIGNNR